MRELRQKEAEEAWFNSSQKSIINACPRFGKIKTAINIFKRGNFNNVLISIPRLDIQEMWENDFIKWGFQGNVQFTTHLSSKKLNTWKGDILVVDEPQELSSQQIQDIKPIVKNNKTLLLSGTITKKTENRLLNHLNTSICYKYTIDQGVEEGVLADYQITIHEIDLEKEEKVKFKKLLWVKNKLENEEKPTFFLDIKLISLIQNSISKRNYTKNLLKQWKDERILVFCGVTEIADSLEIPVYHSKSKEKEIFQVFCNGGLNHLATIKLMKSGITILPIQKSVLNYTSGNPEDGAQKICRMLGIEYNNPDKKADIHLISSKEPFEKERIQTALMFFNKNKITYKTIK